MFPLIRFSIWGHIYSGSSQHREGHSATRVMLNTSSLTDVTIPRHLALQRRFQRLCAECTAVARWQEYNVVCWGQAVVGTIGSRECRVPWFRMPSTVSCEGVVLDSVYTSHIYQHHWRPTLHAAKLLRPDTSRRDFWCDNQAQ